LDTNPAETPNSKNPPCQSRRETLRRMQTDG
jgi:hypothetical protein